MEWDGVGRWSEVRWDGMGRWSGVVSIPVVTERQRSTSEMYLLFLLLLHSFTAAQFMGI